MIDVIAKVCSMPLDFNKSGNKSMVQILRESGYLENVDSVTYDMIKQHLEANPDLIETWENYSADKRTSEGWYFLRENSTWIVGFYRPGGRSEELSYSSAPEACASFILKEIRQIGKNAS